MISRLLVPTVLAFALVLAIVPPAMAVTITFEVRPDGSPIMDQGGPSCGEIEYDTFRPWGVLFTPDDLVQLNIANTLSLCLSPPNALGRCCFFCPPGVINITFVLPETDSPTVVDAIELTLLTTNTNFVGVVRTYDIDGVLLDTWSLTRTWFCYEPPQYYDFYHFSAPGRIARVECTLQVVSVDDVIVTEASTPIEGSTWGKIKNIFR